MALNPENDKQSKEMEAVPTEERTSRLAPDDPSLALVKKPAINKKTLRIAVSILGSLVFFGLVVGLSPHKPKTAQEKDKGKQQYTKQIPSDLDITAQDYAPVKGQTVEGPKIEPYSPQPGPVGDQNTFAPQYGTYNRNPAPDQTVQFPDQRAQQSQPQSQNQNQQPAPKNSPWSLASFGGSSADEEAKKRLAVLTSGFFFPWASPEDQKQLAKQKSDAEQQTDQQSEAQANAISAAYESPYNKQNMAKEKQAFLNSQQADYSAYLDNHYLTPVDSTHLLQAGTLIPITMITSINSDLPGTIISQINENVFDTLTGENILIPRGSRLIGNYDNSVAFGQDRVLVAWQRLIRTDGISISLRAMKGADLQGKSGLHDQVDYHLANILAAVGASTAFNVATNAAIAAMSTNQFLSSLAAAMTAQGSTSSNVTSAATQAGTTYAQKLIDQQPTIIIREGTRAYCLIDRDMILPAFVDQDGGYMPAR